MNPNRAARRSPKFQEAVSRLRAYALAELEGENDFNRAIASVVLERVAHGLPQTVSTAHLQERCRRAGTGGGRFWSQAPGYGSVVRILDRLQGVGVLDWNPCEYDRAKGKSPPRVLRLVGKALWIVRTALAADWIPAVLRVCFPAVPREVVPRVQPGSGADPASPVRPPGDGANGLRDACRRLGRLDLLD